MVIPIEKPVYKGANFFMLLIAIGFGIAIWMIPRPEGVSAEAWHLFAIFFATIVGIIVRALPLGGMAILALCAIVLTRTLTIQESLSGFSSPIIWLIVSAFLIARSFIKTGLGMRIAYYFIGILGKKSIGLGYGVVLTDLLLAPAIPSNTARSGGIIFPIIRSLAISFDSRVQDGTTRRIGSYLIQVAYQANIVTCAMFLTAVASNPLVVEIAGGMGISISWGLWALAASVPGILSLILIPLVLYKLYPPEIKETPKAAEFAQEHLKTMGKMSLQEWITLGVFFLLLFLWIFGKDLAGIHSASTALVGLGVLLVSGVLTMEDVKNEKGAWNTLIWFSTLLMMAGFLHKLGMIAWFTGAIESHLLGFDWHFTAPLLVGIYFFSHYFFASMTAHVSSMYGAFLGVGIAVGAPPILIALLLGYVSSLYASLTHYGTSPGPLLYGSGYVGLKMWWKLGFVVGVMNLLIWMTIGSLWWKFLGIW